MPLCAKRTQIVFTLSLFCAHFKYQHEFQTPCFSALQVFWKRAQVERRQKLLKWMERYSAYPFKVSDFWHPTKMSLNVQRWYALTCHCLKYQRGPQTNSANVTMGDFQHFLIHRFLNCIDDRFKGSFKSRYRPSCECSSFEITLSILNMNLKSLF